MRPGFLKIKSKRRNVYVRIDALLVENEDAKNRENYDYKSSLEIILMYAGCKYTSEPANQLNATRH